jgi:hypothetical protein
VSVRAPFFDTSRVRLVIAVCVVVLLSTACGFPAGEPLEEPVGPPASPSLVGVGLLDPSSPSVDQVCVGAVVGDGRVLTAAHCLLGADGRLVRPLVRLSETGEWLDAHPVAAAQSAFSGAGAGVGDVVVLEVDTATPNAVGMAFGSAELDDLYLAFADSLDVLSVDVVEGGDCDSDGIICVQVADGSRPLLCPGDSGSPLVNDLGEVVAVASYGGECDVDGVGVYAVLQAADESAFEGP